MALACTPAGAQAAPPLVGQWSLDSSHEDGASEVTPDSSGNGLDLRAPNGAVHLGTPARFGTGATLGTNVTPLQITSSQLAPAQVTLLAWVKQSGNPGTLHYIAGRGDDGLTCGGSTFALYSGYPGNPGLHFYVRTASGGSAGLTTAPPDATVFDGQWHLLAGTYDGAAARLYVDGVLAVPPAAAPGPLNYALGGGNSFYVDGYAVEGCSLSPNADDWPGSIDEVRLYDRALSASELARLAAATGPNPPELVTDESLLPPPVQPAGPAAAGAPAGATASTATSGDATGAAQGLAKAVEVTALAQAIGRVAGAKGKAPSEVAQSALAAAQDKALEAMKSAAGSSQVAAAQRVDVSPKEAKQTKPDLRIQARLEAMKYGIGAQVPVASAGQAVEAVATVVVEKKSHGAVKTQTIVLPPAVGVADASQQAQMQFAVDKKATEAMTKRDVAEAAVSVQAVGIDNLSGLGEQLALRLQTAMDARSKEAATLSNVLKKLDGTQQAIAQNIKGGETPSERKDQQELEDKAAKLDKQAKVIEQARDEANQKATEAMQQAVADLVNGIAAGTGQTPGGGLPSASSALSGCKQCGFAEMASK